MSYGRKVRPATALKKAVSKPKPEKLRHDGAPKKRGWKQRMT